MPFKTWFVFIVWAICAQFPASAQSLEPWFATALKREPLLTTPAPSELPTLAVIDDGVWCSSPNLKDVAVNKTLSKSFVTDNNFCISDAGHGTKVASIAAAVAKNRLSLVSLRAFSGQGPFYDPSGFAAALRQIADWQTGFVVVNASEITAPDQNLFAAVKSLKDKALVVAAAGNSHSKQIQALCLYAGQLPNVICVGAADQTGKLWVDSAAQGSNYGPAVDLAAYGANMYAPYDSGTSWAAPVVSGLGLLVYQNLQALGFKPTPALLKQIIIAGSRDDDSLTGLLANPKLACGENLLATAQKAMARWEEVAAEPLFGKDPVENQVATIAVFGGELPLSQLKVEMRFRNSDTAETTAVTPLGISRDSDKKRDLITFTAPPAGRYWLSLFIEGMIDTVEVPITVANPRAYHLAEGTLGASAEMPAGPGQEISVLLPGTKIPESAEAWIKLSPQGEPDDWHQLVFESFSLAAEAGYVEARFQLPTENFPEFEGQNSLVIRVNGEFVQNPLTIFLNFPLPPREE